MQFDLMVQKNLPETDPETGIIMIFALIAQDSYSRFTFAVPLPRNKASNIQQALDAIFATGYKPQSVIVSVTLPVETLAHISVL